MNKHQAYRVHRGAGAFTPLLTRRSAGKLLAALTWLPFMTRGARAAGQSATATPGGADPFVVYYAYENDPAIADYRLAVLDSDVSPEALAHGTEMTLLAYLSVGEVEPNRAYFNAVAAEGLLGAANANWPDARFVDMRDPRWSERLVSTVVPAILERGFQGLLIDTLDNAEFMEFNEPVRFAGMIDAAADLMRRLRRSFPDIMIMVNRGYGVLPAIAGEFDCLLGESVMTRHDGAGGYEELSPADIAWQRSKMAEARARDRRLTLFSLDYWDPQDTAGIARIYAAERAEGFIPYVATRDLTRIVPEPAS
jgi:polysaccharide biosynthesis protein PelA